ncbi:hypothetical protein F5B22DRAFT_239730 [Xylaria bambusicola]|uniref:uncharacterized protein n=1 Tax=Xylaria bambusicola TaxID=326684 RepID=UPI0020080929|nr:uncharacterized protein F5B22DRAFT_239730 [Xylaria bambusicola]KAI0514411.1 hypothetical protein F5B22DRAFT_239730 [Xylaria bambusicola]
MYGKVFTTLAALASVVAATTLTTSNGRPLTAGHGILIGAAFDVSAEAGYFPKAPGFDVTCPAYYVYDNEPATGTECSWDGEQPKNNKVYAYTNYDTLAVTLRHEWAGEGGVTYVTTAVGKLASRPKYNQDIPPFSLTVSKTATKL